MSTNRPAAGGGREILVAARRFSKWIDGFDNRHRIAEVDYVDTGMRVRAHDDAVAECQLPLGGGAPPDAGGDSRDRIDRFVELAQQAHRVGVLLGRRRGVAVGVFNGADLEISKVDSSYVQSRTAAGGWSQQRYARRRAGQASKAADRAADIVNRLLIPHRGELDAIVTAGDKTAVTAILRDDRLDALADKIVTPHIGDVAEPKLATLRQLPDKFWSVRILLTEPEQLALKTRAEII